LRYLNNGAMRALFQTTLIVVDVAVWRFRVHVALLGEVGGGVVLLSLHNQLP
jgi:hypothetical protein